jgi:hypothetical protein
MGCDRRRVRHGWHGCRGRAVEGRTQGASPGAVPVLGGLTHSFTLEGFTWDAGIHYLSGIAPGDPARELLNWLAETPIEFTPLGAVYDNLHIGDAAPLALSRPFEAQERDLKDRFPDEAAAVPQSGGTAGPSGAEVTVRSSPERRGGGLSSHDADVHPGDRPGIDPRHMPHDGLARHDEFQLVRAG